MDADHLPLGDPVWRDAYLIGGEVRLTEVALASLISQDRVRSVTGTFFLKRGDEALDPTETIQRVTLNVISLEQEPTLASVASRMTRTEPVLVIERELTGAGLIKRQFGRLKPTSDGKKEAARLVAANAHVRGPRGVAYNGPSAADH